MRGTRGATRSGLMACYLADLENAMTIRVTLECDAMKCHNSIELYDMPSDEDVHGAGWHENPHSPEDHYCNKCWPTCKAEIEEISGEDL